MSRVDRIENTNSELRKNIITIVINDLIRQKRIDLDVYPESASEIKTYDFYDVKYDSMYFDIFCTETSFDVCRFGKAVDMPLGMLYISAEGNLIEDISNNVKCNMFHTSGYVERREGNKYIIDNVGTVQIILSYKNGFHIIQIKIYKK